MKLHVRVVRCVPLWSTSQDCDEGEAEESLPVTITILDPEGFPVAYPSGSHESKEETGVPNL